MKKGPTLVVDDADEDEVKETTVQDDKAVVASAAVTPRGYLNLGYLLMKYLIVLPKKRSDRDGYIISYLLKAGAQGIAAVELVKKSRSELAAEGKAEKELGLDPRCKDIAGHISDKADVISIRIEGNRNISQV